MKFSIVHFVKQLEISGMPQSNRFLLMAQEGFSLEHDAATNGIVARHANLPNALWFPAVSIAMATILPEPVETLAAPLGEVAKRKGRAA